MMKLIRTLACLVLAVAMASVSLAASAHGAVVIDEAGYHTETVASELPCADCGSHRLRVCAQSCFASLDAVEPEISALGTGALSIDPPPRDSMRVGKPPEPLLGPPIA